MYTKYTLTMRKCFDFLTKTWIFKRFCHASNKDLRYIRNLGILAHIDAGKTTTTERMLFYAGKIQSMGEVHHGNTVTDFLDEERERGITISSAAVSFEWKEHLFNLIDTPGHIDFTMEVERSLNVLDGAVVILDGTAGVEAQTLTVWYQSERYNLPRLIYLNKLDRPNASVERCIDTLRAKLSINPFLLQLPIYDSNQQLKGIVDLITMTLNSWEKGDGRVYEIQHLNQDDNNQIWDHTLKMRNELVEQLADHDEFLAEKIIEAESHNVSGDAIIRSVKNITMSRKGFPVVCGSSYKNIGIQLLMDSVIHFLPSPTERNQLISHCFEKSLCARAFKVIHDSQKKPVTFFRVYSGSFSKGQKIYNIQQDKSEQISKLMIPYADESVEVSAVSAGNIAAVSGLKITMTGDFVTSNEKTASRAKKKLSTFKGESMLDNFGQSANIPDPVFHCSIEAPSQAFQTQLETALDRLQREDPSLKVFQDEETSQTVLGGMGELHIEVIKNRILSEYKIEVELGKLQIAYHEIPEEVNVQQTHIFNPKIGNSKNSVNLVLSIISSSDKEKKRVVLDTSPERAENTSAISRHTLTAIERGVERAFSHGPKMSCPVVNTGVMVHWCEVTKGTLLHVVEAVTAQCVQKMLKDIGTKLLEPIMFLQVATDKNTSSSVISDLSRRRCVIQQVSPRGQQVIIDALVPLAELLGYAGDLRQLTSGSGSFTMELDSYQFMTLSDEAQAMKRYTGFDI